VKIERIAGLDGGNMSWFDGQESEYSAVLLVLESEYGLERLSL